MKKIVLIGSGGAGKSTLAKQLGEKLNIEVTHLDARFWQSGWVATPKDEWTKIQKEIVSKDKWIVDGNFGGTMDLRLENADTIIFLDFPRFLCLSRVIKRRIIYHNRTRPDMGENCPEKLDFEFLKWIWNYPKQKRPAIIEKLNFYSKTKKVFVVRSKNDVKLLLVNTHKEEVS